MNETAVNCAQDSRVSPLWRRAGVLVAGLIATLAIGAMLAKIVVARVPQQRASIERALRAHTGLDIRFAKMQVGWGIRGAQAKLSDVHIGDPRANRFTATAPQVHVTFDTWGLFRGGELSLGRVTLVRPVIDIDLAQFERAGVASASLPTNKHEAQRAQSALERNTLDSVARVLRALPPGRLELEAATLRLAGAQQLSARELQITRAVVRRETDSATAYATFLLPSELGKTAFVSVDARGLFTRGAAFDADVRVITRQVQLAGVAPGRRVDGSVSLDARAHVVRGVVTSASWQANLRRMAIFNRAAGGVPLRFARADVNGTLRREADRWRLAVENFHVAPADGAGRAAEFVVDARADGQQGIATSDDVPLPILQFLLAAGSQADQYVWPHEIAADSGKLRHVKLEWGGRNAKERDTRVDAVVDQGAVLLADAGLRLEGVRGRLQGGSGNWRFEFAPEAPVRVVRSAHEESAGLAHIEGAIDVEQQAKGVVVSAENIRATSGRLEIGLGGRIESQPAGVVALKVELVNWDTDAARQYLGDVVPKSVLLAALEPLSAGRISSAKASLNGLRGADGALVAKDSLLDVSVSLEDIAWHLRGREEPLVDANVVIRHSQGTTVAKVSGGRVGDINIVSADLAIAPNASAQIRATALASLESVALRKAMPELARLNAAGDALLELQAVVPANSKAPIGWRGTVRLSDGNFAIARGAPAIGDVRGAVSFVDGSLRRSTLAGRWLGGDVRITVPARATRGIQSFAVRGVATAEALAQWVGIDDARALGGDVAWSGTVDWDSKRSRGVLIIESGLTGLSSSLPEPFAKRATRALPIVARLDFDSDGLRNFDLHANRKSFARGTVREHDVDAAFAIANLRGTVRGSTARGDWRVSVDTLQVDQVPELLAIANAIAKTPAASAAKLAVEELRDARNSYGPMSARFAHDRNGFMLEHVAASSLYRGDDVQLACRVQCELAWQIAVGDQDRLLQLLAVDAALKDAVWRSTGSLSWASGSTPALSAMTGRGEAEMTGGHWQPRAGMHNASFVDAVFSPVAALRPDGTAIARFHAGFEFGQGAARVTDWRMNLADGDLVARGQIDIADRRHQLELDWHPHNELPSSVADLASRPRLAAAWAALRARMGGGAQAQSTSERSQVRLGGTWSAPLLMTPDLVAQE